MRRIIETAAVLAAATVTALAIPLSAHAAGGVFLVESLSGAVIPLENPRDGRCYPLPASMGVSNHTSAAATLYESADCAEGSEEVVVEPGEQHEGDSVRSVMFGR